MNTPTTPSVYGLTEQSVICLTGRQIQSFCSRRNTKNLHLIEGRAWVTYDDNDVIVESGETIAIPTSRHRVIISPTSPNHSISYQLS